jgi:hypothetical protein
VSFDSQRSAKSGRFLCLAKVSKCYQSDC